MQGRFESVAREVFDDGWTPDEPDTRELKTFVTIESARSIISHNDSPDVGFSQSINPYRGCEHGCIYCYARPSHAYLELSPGLDFETRLFAKTNAAERLREELAKPGYQPSTIALGANTDCYQPIERKYRITRQILEVLAECEHPVSIVPSRRSSNAISISSVRWAASISRACSSRSARSTASSRGNWSPRGEPAAAPRRGSKAE